MKTSRITNYDPTLSVKQNAINNGVSDAAIRAFIQKQKIDRAADLRLDRYNRIRDYVAGHPLDKAPRIAEVVGLSENTVRKYLKMTEPPRARENKTTMSGKIDKMKFISISTSQTDILKVILAIHLPRRERFQCDITAWKLGFYRDGLLCPELCYDKYASKLKNPSIHDLEEFRTTWADGTFENLVVDLPCSVEPPSTKSRIDVSTHFPGLSVLLEEHAKMLQLAHNKLQTGGILVYKTMDFTYFGAPYWLSDEVLRMAHKAGFELADKFIYYDEKQPRINPRRKRFVASVPAHAYFFVFRKTAQKNRD